MDWGADTDLVRDELDELFTDREDQQALVRTLASAPAGEPVPVQGFVGVSGAGKTYLRKRLKRLLRSNDVPTVERDFDQRREAIDAAALVTQLISAGRLEAPRTFLALLRLAMKESESDVKALSQELASDALGAAADFFMSGLENLGTAGFLKSLGNFWHNRYKASKDPINRYLATEEGKRDQIRIASLEGSDLRDGLYDRLAQDIAAKPIRPGKAVQLALLVDSYDFAFQAQSTPDDRRRSLEWISDLSNAFVRRGSSERILVLCFGQTAGVVLGKEGSIVEHRLGGFERAYAEEYWRKRNLPEVHLEAALEASREEGVEERYHVFSLGLAGDMVTTNPDALVEKESRQGKDRPSALTERFLRLLLEDDQMNLKQLALTQWWDDDSAAWVFGVARNYNQTQVKLAWLKRFSFVQEVSEGRFTLHSVMRRVLPETSNPKDVSRWQQEWINHWTSRSANETDDFAAQVWRHRFAFDIGSAIGDWEAKSDAALSEMRSADHLWYITVAQPLVFRGFSPLAPDATACAAALGTWGNAAQVARLGELRILLYQSISAYRLALEVRTRDYSPAQWAMTQNNLGTALRTLGAQGDAQALRESISAYRLALEVRTRDYSPAQWAMTQNNLGNALQTLGKQGDAQALRESISAYRLALEVRTRDYSPADWAMTQNNLGNALQTLGVQGDAQALRESISAYRLALEVRTRDYSPADWAMTQNNLGVALQTLGEQGDAEALRESISAYRLALEVRTRDYSPAQWAMTQNNLGNALQTLGKQGDAQALRESISAYRLALEVNTRDFSPADWAMTQNNLGNALQTLGKQGDAQALRESISAYRRALEVLTRDSSPFQWAMTQNNLGTTLRILGKQGDAQALRESISAYRLALEVYTRDYSPAQWAITQNNLGDALMIRARMNSDPESAREALASYELAEEGCLLSGMSQYGPYFAKQKRKAREFLGEK